MTASNNTLNNNSDTQPAKPSNRLNGLLVLIVLLSLCAPVSFASPTLLPEMSAAIPSYSVTSETRRIPLSDVLWMEDASNELTINEVIKIGKDQWTQTQDKYFNFGHSDSTFWVAFKLEYQPSFVDTPETSWLLQLSFPLLDVAAMHYFDEKQQLVKRIDVGLLQKISTRPINHRDFLYPVRLEPGDSGTYYLQISREGAAIQAPIKLWNETAFLDHTEMETYIYGFVLGILLAMMIYNSILSVSMNNSTYLFYVLYIAFALLSYFSISGIGFAYFWPENPWFNRYCLSIGSCFSAAAILTFCRYLLNTKELFPKCDLFMRTQSWIGVALVALTFALDHVMSIPLAIYVFIASTTIIGVCFHAWRKGSRQAGFILVSRVPTIIGITLYLCSIMGWIPDSMFNRHGMLIGHSFEVLLLAFTMADQIRIDRRDKYNALNEQHKSIVKLQEAESKILHRALHSGSTGLPNRSLLRRCLDERCARNEDSKLGLIIVSLDNFHEFNKTLGHRNGDEILRIVTRRLSDVIATISNSVVLEDNGTEQHRLANVEGVRFGFIVETQHRDQAFESASRALQALELPFEYQSLLLDIEASVGITLYPDDTDNNDVLLRNAQIALELAKNAPERIAYYSVDIDPYSSKRLTLISELKQAIEQDALELYYQPQITLSTGEISGFEVLLRWNHPIHGYIPPIEFIPLAERTGVIQSLTYWVCNNALRNAKMFAEKGYQFPVSINISARNLQDPTFKSKILELALAHEIVLDNIVLELTETAIMVNTDEAQKILTELSYTGMKLSIDDFGTGYSSLSYLKRLPVKELKIDRAFVMDMATDKDDQIIVETTVQMAHSLGIEVVAEGIEDQATLDHLSSIGCDYAQGYHIGRPMCAADFIQWVDNYRNNRDDHAPQASSLG